MPRAVTMCCHAVPTICICICIYVCVCICMICMRMHMCMCMHTHTCMHLMHMHMYPGHHRGARLRHFRRHATWHTHSRPPCCAFSHRRRLRLRRRRLRLRLRRRLRRLRLRLRLRPTQRLLLLSAERRLWVETGRSGGDLGREAPPFLLRAERRLAPLARRRRSDQVLLPVLRCEYEEGSWKGRGRVVERSGPPPSPAV